MNLCVRDTSSSTPKRKKPVMMNGKAVKNVTGNGLSTDDEDKDDNFCLHDTCSELEEQGKANEEEEAGE